MKNTKSKIIIVMCVALLIMVTGYAYFATNLDITATGNITTNWSVKFISITSGNNGGTGGSNAITPTFTDTTATMSANLQVPGDYMEYDLVLQNTGNIDAIIESIDAHATGSPAIIFSISGINNGDELARGASKTIKIKIEYDYYVTSQPTDTTKTLTVSIKAVQDTGQSIEESTPNINQPLYLRSEILKNNIAQSDANIDFKYSSEGCYYDTSSGQVCDDSKATNGLYYTNTNTKNNQTTYYFRGAVDNNNVQFGKADGCVYKGEAAYYFDASTEAPNPTEEQCESTTVCSVEGLNIVGLGDMCADMGGVDTLEYATYNVDTPIYWKIIRINEDGSIRLVYNGPSTTGAYVTIGNSKFNTNYDDNAYVGYMYGTPSSSTYALTHANTNDSTIKDYLDEWYIKNLSSYSSYLADAGFCNDRSVAPSAGLWDSSDTALGYSTKETYYGAYNRLYTNKKPQFACSNEERDLFTTSASSEGNKKLTNPIGLITMDEVAYAGGVYGITNESMYLSGGYIWTMSPFLYDATHANVWNLHVGGFVNGNRVDGERDVRPAVNLQSEVEVSTDLPEGCTKLDGTEACPYIIKTN